MLHGRNNENILHNNRIFFSHKKNDLLFLQCNMAAVQNLHRDLSKSLELSRFSLNG